MRYCPKCLTITQATQCGNDGATTQDDPVMGELVDGRYRVVQPIGRGGMGSVYRALDEPLGRHVALKILKPSRATDAGAAGRFAREARVLAALRHPNTVVLHHWGQVPVVGCFMVTELLEGETLNARLRQQGALSIQETLKMASSVARSLAQAQQRGIVHRDLKPANIFFDKVDEREEVVKVLDFGVAKFFERPPQEPVGYQTGINDVVGTPAYLSPEQIRTEELDGRADHYALGIIMFQCLTGRLPFTAPDPFVLMRMMIEDPPPPLPHGVPDAVGALVLSLLAKKREDRPQRADALARTLEELQVTHRHAPERTMVMHPVNPDEATVVETQALTVPRRDWNAGLGGAAAGCLLTLLAVAALPSTHAAPPAAAVVASVEPAPPLQPPPLATHQDVTPASVVERPSDDEEEPPTRGTEASTRNAGRAPRRAVPKTPAAEAGPRDVSSRLLREANRAMVEGKFADAEARAQVAAEMQPNNADAHKLLGVALGRQGKFCEAAAHYRKVLQLPASEETLSRIRDILKEPDMARCK